VWGGAAPAPPAAPPLPALTSIQPLSTRALRGLALKWLIVGTVLGSVITWRLTAWQAGRAPTFAIASGARMPTRPPAVAVKATPGETLGNPGHTVVRNSELSTRAGGGQAATPSTALPAPGALQATPSAAPATPRSQQTTPSTAAAAAPVMDANRSSAPVAVRLANGREPAGALKSQSLVGKPNPLAAATSSLSAEVAALDFARAAAQRGDSDEALRRIARYHRDFPAGVLSVDADAAAIEILSAAGRSAAAARLAEQFLANHPNDPHAANVRRSLSE